MENADFIMAFGAIGGWLLGTLMGNGGLGFIANIVIGIIGAFLGKIAFAFLQINIEGLVGDMISSLIGGATLLLLVLIVAKKS